MSDNNKIVLVGYAGHGIVVAEAALTSNMNLQLYAELNKLKTNPFEIEYLGFEGADNFIGWNYDYEYILGIGDNQIRQKIGNLIFSKNKILKNVFHNTASISKTTKVGIGNFFARNVAINPLVEIGDYCILNTGCIIEHECKISNAVHIAPGVVLAGNVTVGANTFIGANAVVKQGITIGRNVIIGAGSVVIKDVLDNKKIVGNPSREI